jgi:NDP-sugar pyrophosphorylase family protein
VTLANTPVAILAGGRATRLGPLAADLPKALLPVAGQPFVDHQLALLYRRGVRRVVLCVGHLADQIVAHVGDGQRFGVDVAYSFDGPQPLGTGGALRQATPLLGSLFWVLYGDSYLDFDYGAALERFQLSPELALMTIYRNEGRWDTSNVLCVDGRVSCYDKRQPRPEMAFIDYGASLLTEVALARLPTDRPADLADLYHDLAADGLLAGYEVTQRFYEVGSFDGLRETEAFLIAKRQAAAGLTIGRTEGRESGA